MHSLLKLKYLTVYIVKILIHFKYVNSKQVFMETFNNL